MVGTLRFAHPTRLFRRETLSFLKRLSPQPSPRKNGAREKKAHASSDTCPSGRPNSNVFSVIDTIV
jgi:hypothetical protein